MNETLRMVLTIIQVIICLVLVVVVLFQQGKSAGLSGAISGAADTFFGKNKARSLDAKLEKLTGWFAGAFIIMTFVLSIF